MSLGATLTLGAALGITLTLGVALGTTLTDGARVSPTSDGLEDGAMVSRLGAVDGVVDGVFVGSADGTAVLGVTDGSMDSGGVLVWVGKDVTTGRGVGIFVGAIVGFSTGQTM